MTCSRSVRASHVVRRRRENVRDTELNAGEANGRRRRGALPSALNRPRRTRDPGLVVVVVARGHAVHDRRMTPRVAHAGTQSIFVRQRGAASRFASHHVRLGPVRRVPRLASRLANRRCQPPQPHADRLLHVVSAAAREVAPIAGAQERARHI